MTAFPDLQVLMDALLDRDGRLEYRWILGGTNTGPGGTGNSVRISGLIAASLGHFDQAEYYRQLEFGADGTEGSRPGRRYVAHVLSRFTPFHRGGSGPPLLVSTG